METSLHINFCQAIKHWFLDPIRHFYRNLHTYIWQSSIIKKELKDYQFIQKITAPIVDEIFKRCHFEGTWNPDGKKNAIIHALSSNRPKVQAEIPPLNPPSTSSVGSEIRAAIASPTDTGSSPSSESSTPRNASPVSSEQFEPIASEPKKNTYFGREASCMVSPAFMPAFLNGLDDDAMPIGEIFCNNLIPKNPKKFTSEMSPLIDPATGEKLPVVMKFEIEWEAPHVSTITEGVKANVRATVKEKIAGTANFDKNEIVFDPGCINGFVGKTIFGKEIGITRTLQSVRYHPNKKKKISVEVAPLGNEKEVFEQYWTADEFKKTFSDLSWSQ